MIALTEEHYPPLLGQTEDAPPLMTIEGHKDELSVGEDELVLVKIRYKDRDATEEDPSYQVNAATPAASIEESFEDATGDLQWAAAVAAFASIRSAPWRNRPASPIGAMPNGDAYPRPNRLVVCGRADTSTR